MQKLNVLITSEYFGKYSHEAATLLKQSGHNVIPNPYGHKFLTSDEIIPYIGEADAIICDLEKITREVIDAAPNLKIIARRGVGTDSVDTVYAKERGIEVARTLGVVEAPVAELVIGYILALSRNLIGHASNMRQGAWERIESSSVEGKTLGIAGMGRIGFEVSRRANAFGMNIIYYDEVENTKAQNCFGAKRVEFNELLALSDFISLHVPLTDKTERLFNYETISCMKSTAFLINTARGAVVEENGLVRAISESKISGAALDVYDYEPKTDSPLRGFPNVILTPHIGTFTRETFIKMDTMAAENIIRFKK